MNLKYICMHVWLIGVKPIKTLYMYMISNIAYPLSLLFAVGVLSDGKLLPFALSGGLVALTAANTLVIAGEIAVFRLQNRYQDLIVSTNAGPIDYMIGETIAGISWAIPGIAFYFAMDLVYGILNPYRIVMTLFVSALLIISLASIAFVMASRVKYVRNIWAISGILSILLMTISPTFYPYTYIPKYVLFALSIIPTTPAAVLEQGIFGIAPIAWYMLPILIVECIIYVMIAKWFIRWRED